MSYRNQPQDVISTPSAGGTLKHPDTCDDALGNPGRFSKQTVFDAKEVSGKCLEAVKKQNGRNGLAAN